MAFSILDIVFVGLIGLFMIRCYLKGFVSELLSMAAIVLGILASLFLYKNGGELLRRQFFPEMQIIPEVIAFVLLFVIVFFIVKLVERMLTNIIDEVSLTSADSYLGLVIGLAEGVAVICLVLFILKIQPLFDTSKILDDSFFARLFLPFITGRETDGGV